MENKDERYQKAVNIMDVLEQSPFAKIMKKGLAINELNQKFNRIFPQEFHGKFRIGSVNGNSLFLEVSNAIVRQGINSLTFTRFSELWLIERCTFTRLNLAPL